MLTVLATFSSSSSTTVWIRRPVNPQGRGGSESPLPRAFVDEGYRVCGFYFYWAERERGAELVTLLLTANEPCRERTVGW